MGLLGLSVMVASGDAGVTNIGHGDNNCSPFVPQYPGSSPFVTSVGATALSPVSDTICKNNFNGVPLTCDKPVMEVAVAADNGMVWTTGGGFSNRSAIPSYQAAAVQAYLEKESGGLPPANLWNSAGRAYPDVSAIGHNLLVIIGGAVDLADGTSASTPIFAGVVSLLNGLLLEASQQPLGFLNPLLYQAAEEDPSSFYDVTIGDNACGEVLHPPHVACCPYGFSATTGFDPVTGLGTPNFEVLANVIADIRKSRKL